MRDVGESGVHWDRNERNVHKNFIFNQNEKAI